MRTPLIAANWKMNLGREEQALQLSRRILHRLSEIEGCDMVICPPFLVIPTLANAIHPLHPVAIGAQNMHWEDKGAHTGEISPTMLAGLCDYVILGHSERRAAGSKEDSDEGVNKKIKAALAYQLTPIVCVGENLEQREAEQTETWVRSQVESAFEGVTAEKVVRCVIAYEPIWAIGTGKSASAAEANRVISLIIRGTLAEMFGEEAAQQVRILYGGSVKPDNIAGYMAMADIDGALVGGASLNEGFVDLVANGAAALIV